MNLNEAYWSGTPRNVPLSLQVRLLVGGLGVQVFGWIWAGFSVLLVWVFTLSSTLFHPSLIYFNVDKDIRLALLTHTQSTGFSEGDNRIVAYHYRFQMDDTDYSNVSYESGSTYEVGDTVTIEYRLANPQSSRIQYMRTKPIGALGGFIPLFFLGIGLSFIGRQAKSAIQQIRLLRTGIATTAQLVSGSETTVSDGGQMYAAVYTFLSQNDRLHSIRLKRYSQFAHQDIVLYNVQYPKKNCLVSDFETNIEIVEHRNLKPYPIIKTILVLMIPCFVLVSLLGCLIIKLLVA